MKPYSYILNRAGGCQPPGTVPVNLEQRVPPRDLRSKISVDGNDLAAGTYTARVISGANQASSGSQATGGDELEFDFDSNTEAGATRIAPGFIQGTPGTVTGQILAGASVVAQATVSCELKN